MGVAEEAEVAVPVLVLLADFLADFLPAPEAGRGVGGKGEGVPSATTILVSSSKPIVNIAAKLGCETRIGGRHDEMGEDAEGRARKK